MNRKFILLFITGMIIFIIIIFGINLAIKKYEREELSIQTTLPQIKEENLDTGRPAEEKSLEVQDDEPEREVTTQNQGPLLN